MLLSIFLGVFVFTEEPVLPTKVAPLTNGLPNDSSHSESPLPIPGPQLGTSPSISLSLVGERIPSGGDGGVGGGGGGTGRSGPIGGTLGGPLGGTVGGIVGASLGGPGSRDGREIRKEEPCLLHPREKEPNYARVPSWSR